MASELPNFKKNGIIDAKNTKNCLDEITKLPEGEIVKPKKHLD